MSITTRAPYGLELEVMPLEAFGGVRGHKLTPIAASMMRIQPQGGSVRRIIAPVIAVAAAVAAPYLVPALSAALAGSIGLAAATTATTIAAGTVYGAAAGAASAFIGGGNVGRSALIGGAIGGIGAGIGAAYGGGGEGAGVGTMGGGDPLGGAETVSALGEYGNVAGAAATPGADFTYTASEVGAPAVTSEVSAGLVETPVSNAYDPTSVNAATGGTPDLGSQLSSTAGTTQTVDPFNVQTVDLTAGQPQVGLNTATASQTAQAAQTAQVSPDVFDGQFVETPAYTQQVLSNIPDPKTSWASAFGKSLTERVTDPKLAAETVLRAAGQLAGSAMTGSGLSAEQQQLVDMQTQELKQLQQQNTQAFNQRLEAAQAILGDVDYFDPEYFGLQRARQQQIAGGQAKSAGLRGLTGNRRQAEARTI